MSSYLLRHVTGANVVDGQQSFAISQPFQAWQSPALDRGTEQHSNVVCSMRGLADNAI